MQGEETSALSPAQPAQALETPLARQQGMEEPE
jgi:hypothetical protein